MKRKQLFRYLNNRRQCVCLIQQRFYPIAKRLTAWGRSLSVCRCLRFALLR